MLAAVWVSQRVATSGHTTAESIGSRAALIGFAQAIVSVEPKCDLLSSAKTSRRKIGFLGQQLLRCTNATTTHPSRIETEMNERKPIRRRLGRDRKPGDIQLLFVIVLAAKKAAELIKLSSSKTTTTTIWRGKKPLAVVVVVVGLLVLAALTEAGKRAFVNGQVILSVGWFYGLRTEIWHFYVSLAGRPAGSIKRADRCSGARRLASPAPANQLEQASN